MDPIKTAAANFVYRGPHDDIGDLWVQRIPADAPRGRAEQIRSVWRPTDEERRMIAEGGAIELALWYAEPIPPLSVVALSAEQAQPVGEHAFRIDDFERGIGLGDRPVTDNPQA